MLSTNVPALERYTYAADITWFEFWRRLTQHPNATADYVVNGVQHSFAPGEVPAFDPPNWLRKFAVFKPIPREGSVRRCTH